MGLIPFMRFGRPGGRIIVLSVVLLLSAGDLGAVQQHADVWLKNEQGDRIAPGRNQADAYSPRQTCGGCHGYLAVTEGYHFQLGFNALGKRAKGPLPGIYGNGNPLAALSEPAAAKVNKDVRWMGLPIYDWIGAGGKIDEHGKVISAASGWYAPGGGPLEYGRKPDGTPDLSRTLAEAEGLSRAALDGDYSSRFTPDRRSHFRESGVLEADCLICHNPGYRMEARQREISRWNYRWAATAGAGLGEVKGAVFTYRNPSSGFASEDFLSGTWNFSRRPSVSYRWNDRNLFTGEGKLSGRLIRKSVAAKNCLQCHQGLSALREGSLYSPRSDAHARWGLQCTTCHPLMGGTSGERRHHQIAAGSRTCRGCHPEDNRSPRKDMRLARDPGKKHAEKFPRGSFHFLLIDCEGCHVTAQPARGGYLLDEGAGWRYWYTAGGLEVVLRPGDFESPAAEPWKPWMMRSTRSGGFEQYVPCVPEVRQWFGERTAGGELRPIRLDDVNRAFRKIRSLTAVEVMGTDGKKVKRPTVATREDIAAMLKALSSLGFRRAVFVSDAVYELKDGKVVSSPDIPRPTAPAFRMHHGVVPVKSGLTYGAKGYPDGCMDCHSENSPFFTKMKIRNVGRFLKEDYPAPKEPNAVMQMQEWGLESVPSYE